jgi:hypothetical protein
MILKPIIFRHAHWVHGIVAAGLIASVAGAVSIGSKQGMSLLAITLVLLATLFCVGLIDVFFTRVTITSNTLECVSNYRTIKYTRDNIEEVVWSSGCPVSIRLKTGKWVQLPSVGDSSLMANSIRSWLNVSMT